MFCQMSSQAIVSFLAFGFDQRKLPPLPLFTVAVGFTYRGAHGWGPAIGKPEGGGGCTVLFPAHLSPRGTRSGS